MNYIHKNLGALEPHECTFLINYFKQNPDKQVEGLLGFGDSMRVSPDEKKCTEIFLSSNLLIDQFIFKPVARVLKETCEAYIKEFPFLDKIGAWQVAPNFKIQHYKPGEGYFKEHCENDGGSDGDAEYRVIAWMIYLNTVTDGGETVFPTQNEQFKPNRGDVLFWPAYWTHPHHGVVSPSQDKYILTGWYNFSGR